MSATDYNDLSRHIGHDIANTPTQNWCEECGATEPADPEDVAEQIRLLGEND